MCENWGPPPLKKPPTQLIRLIWAERARGEYYNKYSRASRPFVCGGSGSVSQGLMRLPPNPRGCSSPRATVQSLSPTHLHFPTSLSPLRLLLFSTGLHSDGLITFLIKNNLHFLALPSGLKICLRGIPSNNEQGNDVRWNALTPMQVLREGFR